MNIFEKELTEEQFKIIQGTDITDEILKDYAHIYRAKGPADLVYFQPLNIKFPVEAKSTKFNTKEELINFIESVNYIYTIFEYPAYDFGDDQKRDLGYICRTMFYNNIPVTLNKYYVSVSLHLDKFNEIEEENDKNIEIEMHDSIKDRISLEE